MMSVHTACGFTDGFTFAVFGVGASAAARLNMPSNRNFIFELDGATPQRLSRALLASALV